MITDNKKYIVDGNTVLAPQKQVERQKYIEKQRYEKLKKSQKESIKNQKQKEIKKKACILMQIIAGFAVGLILIGRYSVIYNNQNTLKETKANIELVKKDTENLKVQFVKYNNIKYIEEIATKKLHMVKPNISDVYYYDLSKKQFEDTQSNKSQDDKKSIVDKIKNVLF